MRASVGDVDRSTRASVGATLTLRLILWISALLALATLAGGAYVIHEARDDIGAETLSALTLTRRFVDAQLDAMHSEWSVRGFSEPRFHLQSLSDVRHLQVMFYDETGRLLDTNDDGRSRAVAPEWFAFLIRRAAHPPPPEFRVIDFQGHEAGRLSIAADPSYETEEMWRTCRGLGFLLLGFFVVVNAAVWWAASHALRPVSRILSGLQELSDGNLGVRLPAFGLPELTRISVGFNQMAETLEGSVAENQRLTRRLLEANESERTSIARELHDELGQCMSAIHADAAAIRNRGGEAVRESAQAIVEATMHVKQIVRSLLQRLRPPVLEDMGLEAALRGLAAVFQQRNPQVDFSLQCSAGLAQVDAKVGAAVYRVIQECLTNIGVHANARRASVDVTRVPSAAGAPDGGLRVEVVDDGVGFFLLSANQGFGLTGIRERVQLLGGTCDIATEPGRGTRIQLVIPGRTGAAGAGADTDTDADADAGAHAHAHAGADLDARASAAADAAARGA